MSSSENNIDKIDQLCKKIHLIDPKPKFQQLENYYNCVENNKKRLVNI